MANPRRVLRLQQLILEVVAETIQRDLADPRLGLVSVTRVKLSPDLTSALVGWSLLGKESERRLSEKALEAALPVIQGRVGRALGIRTTPLLSFRYDRSLERAQRLDDIFHRLHEEAGDRPQPEGAAAGGERDAEAGETEAGESEAGESEAGATGAGDAGPEETP
jgi:ribosome-binding factor A